MEEKIKFGDQAQSFEDMKMNLFLTMGGFMMEDAPRARAALSNSREEVERLLAMGAMSQETAASMFVLIDNASKRVDNIEQRSATSPIRTNFHHVSQEEVMKERTWVEEARSFFEKEMRPIVEQNFRREERKNRR